MTLATIPQGAPWMYALNGGNPGGLPTIAQGAPWLWTVPSDTNGNSDLSNIYVQADTTGNVSAVSSIQNAFNALPASGGKIVFYPGTYKIDSQIIYQLLANQNVVIEGNGAILTSTMAEPSQNTGIFAFTGDLNATSTLIINNITINHTTLIAPGSGKLACIYVVPLNYTTTGLSSVTNIVLTNVKCTGASLVGCWILGCLQGLLLNCNMSSNRVAGLYLSGCFATCVVAGTYNSNITGTVTEDYGIALASDSTLPPCNGVLITGVTANNNGRKGIDSHHGHNVHITRNTCKGNGYVGIYAVMENATRDTGDVHVVGNIIDQTGGSASLANYGINVGTFGTTGALNPGSFIVTDNEISNVDAGNTNSAAIRIMTATTGVPPERVLIKGNVIKKGSGSAGSVIISDNALAIPYMRIADNICHSANGLVGIYVQSATDCIISGNIVRMDAGAQYAIQALGCTSALVTGNLLQGTYSTARVAAGASVITKSNAFNQGPTADTSYSATLTVQNEISFDALGHINSLDVTHTPTLTSVNANVINQVVAGNDTRGTITFDVQTGTIAASSALFTLTFATAYGTIPVLILQDDSNQTASSFYCSGGATTGYVIRNGIALGVLTSYKISYFTIG